MESLVINHLFFDYYQAIAFMPTEIYNTKELLQCSFMNPSDISKILNSLNINPDEISDKKESQTIRILLHIIEELNEEVQALKAELQKTRDELNQSKLVGKRGQFSTGIFTSPVFFTPMNFSSC